MHYTCRPFIGRQTKSSWSQYWENESDDQNIVSKRGHLFGLVSFDINDDTEVSSLGHELISEINQYYFASVDDDIITRLKMVLGDFVFGLDFQFTNISLILAIVSNSQLYVAILNRGKCIIHRSPSISPILTGQAEQVVTIVGPIKNNDRLLLCTEDFFNKFTWEKIKKLIVLSPVQDLEENFLSTLYSYDDQHGLAAVFIKINTDLLDDNSENSQELPETLIVDSTVDSIAQPAPVSFFKNLFSHRPVYVSHHENTNISKRKKINIFFSLIILLILSVSIFLGYRQNQIRRTESQFQNLKTQLEIKLNNAKALKKIDLEGALAVGKEAKNIVDKMSTLKVHLPEVNQLNEEITTLLSQAGSADFYSPEILFDTSIIDSGLTYNQMFLSKDLLYLLDNNRGRIDVYNITNESTGLISSVDDIKGATSITTGNDKVYILNKQQIFEVQKNNLIPLIDLSKQNISYDIGQIQIWNGALYLLVTRTNFEPTIWKFPPSAYGFSSGQIWLKDKQTLPVDTISFAINGKVWILSKNGTIAPYSLGIREEFNMSALRSLDSASNITTSLDSPIIAFGSSNNLIHVYQKDGQAPLMFNLGKRQILSLALDSNGKFVYALCQDQKIYKISL